MTYSDGGYPPGSIRTGEAGADTGTGTGTGTGSGLRLRLRLRLNTNEPGSWSRTWGLPILGLSTS